MNVKIFPQKQMTDQEKTLRKAAAGMEAVFVNTLFEAMRKTVPESEWSMQSEATKIYQGMQDSEMAQKIADHGGFGMTELIVDYFKQRGYIQSGSVENESSKPELSGGLQSTEVGIHKNPEHK